MKKLFDADDVICNDFMSKLAKSKEIFDLIEAADGVFAKGLSKYQNFLQGAWLGQHFEKSKTRKVWIINHKGFSFYFFGPYKSVINKINALQDKF